MIIIKMFHSCGGEDSFLIFCIAALKPSTPTNAFCRTK